MAQQTLVHIVELAKQSITAYNDKDWDTVKEISAANVTYDEIATNRKVQGINDVLAAWKGWATAFPDSKGTIHNTFTSGNTVVLELTWRGTHTGSLKMPHKEIAPTGKTLNLRACEIMDVNNEKVQAVRHYFDLATLLKQLGVNG
jgi:steroid delta-isomerase-like uncharacterized protein